MPILKSWVTTVVLVPGWLAAQPVAVAPPDPYPVATYSQQVLLKNYALSYCFSRIARDDATRSDALASAGAYLEFGNQGLDAYEAIRSLAEQYVGLSYVSKPEPGVVPSELNTMKCIDLFHSRALHRLTRRLVGSGAVDKKAP